MKYPHEIQKIYYDIKSLTIQGATNVAISTLEGMKLALDIDSDNSKELIDTITDVGKYLAYARPNEPLAQNAILYLRYTFNQMSGHQLPIEKEKVLIQSICQQYLDKIAQDKNDIVDLNKSDLTSIDRILTHCHSSTAVALIKGIAHGDPGFTAVCTETRPRYQGRKTAKNLIEADIDTTLIADSAAESFVIGRGNKAISTVFIGCDAISMKGHCINKIGSWGIAMAAKQASKKVFVVTPLLKIDHDTKAHDVEIEIREDKELWQDAPKGLQMYNPAFEIVDNYLIEGFVTELGILRPSQISDVVENQYPWLFN